MPRSRQVIQSDSQVIADLLYFLRLVILNFYIFLCLIKNFSDSFHNMITFIRYTINKPMNPQSLATSPI